MFEIIGILFVLIGIIFLLIPSQRKKGVFVLPLILGLVITYLHTFGPLAGKNQKVKDVIAMDSTSIVEIHVFPNDNWSEDNATKMVRSDMLIYQQATLNKFCNALNKGTISNDQNKNPLWACYAEILKKDQSIIRLDISRQGSETLIRPVSNSTFRLYYGTIRADEAGILLEQLFRR